MGLRILIVVVRLLSLSSRWRNHVLRRRCRVCCRRIYDIVCVIKAYIDAVYKSVLLSCVLLVEYDCICGRVRCMESYKAAWLCA